MAEGPILVVEDDPDNAALTSLALQEAGLLNEVIVACDGAEALELLLAPSLPLTPCLVLLDIAMPRMDGWETLRRLRGDRRTARVPVVIVTSSEREINNARLRGMGADGYLHKALPFATFSADLRHTVLPLMQAKAA